MINRTATVDVEDLATDHEDADTKIACLIQHAANTNYYVASFRCKGKQLCWKQVCKDEEFLDLFATLDTEINFTEAMYIGLDKCVC